MTLPADVAPDCRSRFEMFCPPADQSATGYNSCPGPPDQLPADASCIPANAKYCRYPDTFLSPQDKVIRYDRISNENCKQIATRLHKDASERTETVCPIIFKPFKDLERPGQEIIYSDFLPHRGGGSMSAKIGDRISTRERPRSSDLKQPFRSTPRCKVGTGYEPVLKAGKEMVEEFREFERSLKLVNERGILCWKLLAQFL